MNDKRIHGSPSEDDAALAGLVADLRAIHAAPLPASLRASIYGGVVRQRRSTAPAMSSEATAGWAGEASPQRVRISLRQGGRRRTRAWPALLAAALVVVCLALLVSQGGKIVPAGKSAVTPAIPAATAGYSSTLCGFRIVVTRAYADANRVFVGYTITPPTGRTVVNGILDDEAIRPLHGVALKPALFMGQPETYGSAITHFTPLGHSSDEEQVAAFEANTEAAGIVPGQSTTFVFTVSDLRTTEFAGSKPVSRTCERYGSSGAGLRQVTVPGPWVVRFTVPVQAAIRQATLHWVVGSGKYQEVVERIASTPTETRIYVHGSDIYPPQIAIGGVRAYHGPDAGTWSDGAEKVFVYNDYASYFHSLYLKPNPWTLAVLGGSAPNSYGQGPPFATLRVNLSSPGAPRDANPVTK